MPLTSSDVSVRRVPFAGWENCWELSNPELRLVVTADVGPRVISAEFRGEEFFHQDTKDLGQSRGEAFRAYGGHRFWIAPENERTLLPDNHSVDVDALPNGARFITTVESLRKELTIEMSESQASAKVSHRVTNLASEPTELAPWALTVMRPGGTAAVPLPPRAPWGPKHLLPDSALVLWSYTDLSLSCWKLHSRFIELEQEQVEKLGFGMQKIGIRYPAAWAAYRQRDLVFWKQAEWREGDYPDLGANVEVFANNEFLELETLGPEVMLATDQSCELVEHWRAWRWTGNDWITPLLP